MGQHPAPTRVAIVTNIPVPYRIPVYELLDGDGIDLTVFYTAEREQNRHWVLPPTSVRSVTLHSVVVVFRGRFIHFTRGVWISLRRARPEVVVTTGFNPPQLIAIAYCLVHRVPHVIQTDGTIESEAVLGRAHRIVRRFVSRRSAAFVAASESGLRLMASWGAPRSRMHRSVLAVDNSRFPSPDLPARTVDVLFAGQLSEVKNPLFAISVVRAAATRLERRLTMAIIGTGPLQDQVAAAAEDAAAEVDVQLAGFQQQDALPGWYGRARVFVFPTTWDPWGLVANEAAAAGTPQIASPAAGSAAELVVRGGAGFVEPLDVERWALRLGELLTDDAAWAVISSTARAAVSPYTFAAAAAGLRDAVAQATGR